MNKQAAKIVLWLALFLTLFGAVSSQGQVSFTDHQPVWGKEVWSGNAGPYKAIEAEVDKKIASGMSAKALADTYQKTAEKDVDNSSSQFRWAYAQRKAVLATHPFDADQLISVRDALGKVNSPHVYEYTRLHFLIETEIFPGQEFLPVGKRLLQHSPNDEDVKYQVINLLGSSRDIADKKQALRLAQEMIKSHPDNADYQGNLGGVYMDMWFRTKDSKYASLAVTQYHKYLALAPPEAEYRKTVERLLKTLQKMGVQ